MSQHEIQGAAGSAGTPQSPSRREKIFKKLHLRGRSKGSDKELTSATGIISSSAAGASTSAIPSPQPTPTPAAPGLLSPVSVRSRPLRSSSTPDLAVTSQAPAPPAPVSNATVGHLDPSSQPSLGSPAAQAAQVTEVTNGPTSIQTPPINASPTKPNLWEQAIANLSIADRDFFSSGSGDQNVALRLFIEEVERVREECRSKRWQLQWNGKQVVLRDKADKVLAWLSKVQGVGDLLAQCDPVHAGIPWAGVRFLLECSLSDRETTGLILMGIEKITNVIARCAIYQRLYLTGSPSESSTRLEASMLVLYAAILTFLSKAKSYLSKHTISRSIAALTGEIKDLLDLVNEHENAIIKEVQNAQAELSVAEHRKLDDMLRSLEEPIVRIDNSLARIQKQLEDSEKEKILTWISTMPYGGHHNTAKFGLTPGTCEWLLKNIKYVEWRKESVSSILWLRGEPGTGKTKLTSRVIKNFLDTREETQSNEALAYFYCDRNNPSRRNPGDILRTLLRQLALIPPALDYLHPAVSDAYKECKKNSEGEFDVDTCTTLMTTLADDYPSTYIVVDALDEVGFAERRILITALKKITLTSKSLVKLFVSSRDEKDIKNQFQNKVGGVSNHYISPRDSEEDIAAFIDSEIANRVEDGTLALQLSGGSDPEAVYDHIRSKLKENAHGMFQWVYLQIQTLCRLHLEQDVEAALNSLPEGLDETYNLIVQAILKEASSSRQIAIAAMQWVVGAKRPVDADTVLGGIYWSTAEGLPVTRETLQNVCHNLVVIDKEFDTVRFNHLSAREYLENSELLVTYLGGNAAVQAISKACFRSLIGGDSCLPELKPILFYATLWWTHYIPDLGHEENWDNELAALFKDFVGSDGRLGAAFLKAARRSKLKLFKIAPWSQNYVYSRAQSLSGSLVFLAAALNLKVLLNAILKADPSAAFLWNDLYEPPLKVAARQGHAEAVELLLRYVSAATEVSDSLRSSSSPLLPPSLTIEQVQGQVSDAFSAALSEKRWGVIEILLRTVVLDGPTKECALRIAAEHGQLGLAEELLKTGAGGINIALDKAAAAGELEVVKYLLANGARDKNGRALRQAADKGKLEVVKLLLKEGPDDINGALRAAATGGQLEIAEFLLENGADDKNGALRTAAAEGELDMVKFLVGEGADDIQGAYQAARRDISFNFAQDIWEVVRYLESLLA